jgi:cell division protein FtsB
MAIGWLTILQSVPWTEVIKNAPKVAEGAKKLWNAVGKQRAEGEAAEAGAQPAVAHEPHTLEALEARAAALEAAVSDLNQQMLASSELIKELAEQNTQLIKRIEANRKRTLWLAAATLVLAIAVLSAVPF